MEVSAANHASTSNNGTTAFSGPCTACNSGGGAKQHNQTYRTMWQWKAARRRLLDGIAP